MSEYHAKLDTLKFEANANSAATSLALEGSQCS